MKWTTPAPPTIGISSYDHTTLDTPIGKFMIEWKSWKEQPSFDILLNGELLTTTWNDLKNAKAIVFGFLIGCRFPMHDEIGFHNFTDESTESLIIKQ